MYDLLGVLAIAATATILIIATSDRRWPWQTWDQPDMDVEYHPADLTNDALFTCRPHQADFNEFRDYARHMRGVDHDA